jgi:hypothetical protein
VISLQKAVQRASVPMGKINAWSLRSVFEEGLAINKLLAAN